MGNSLFDQLKKSGLVDEDRAKKAKRTRHKQVKQQKGTQARPLDEGKLKVQQDHAEKAGRDRALNLQRKQAAEQKAIAAQIRQLIEMNRIQTDDGEIGFNFTDGNRVQRFYVTENQQDHLVRGRLAIVRLQDSYHLVPAGVAEKIKGRDPSCVMILNLTQSGASDADDPYADFQVPDDLMW